MKDKKRLQGKRNRQAGARFEGIVRDDMIKKGWFVSKFQSNVKVTRGALNLQPKLGTKPYAERMKETYSNYKIIYDNKIKDFLNIGGLIPSKGNRFRARTLGFPDFICWKTKQVIYHIKKEGTTNKKTIEQFKRQLENVQSKSQIILLPNIKLQQIPEIIGVEAKSNGYLDRIEKAKCEWLLENKVFSKILIAKKTKVGRKIVPEYIDFKEKYLK